MSMKENSYEDYGLVLSEEVIENIFNKKGFEPDDEVNKGVELYEADICSCAFEFTGDVYPLEKDGKDNWDNGTYYNCKEVFYIPLEKAPSLFEKAYDDIEEVISELKEKIGDCMPEGYDYQSNICHIVGTVWG